MDEKNFLNSGSSGVIQVPCNVKPIYFKNSFLNTGIYKKILNKLGLKYNWLRVSPEKKIEDFTDKICMPQLINLPELKDDRDMIPYICFYDGLSLLQKGDENIQPEDLVKGFQQKKQFLSKKHGDTCLASIKSEFEKPNIDGLLPS